MIKVDLSLLSSRNKNDYSINPLRKISISIPTKKKEGNIYLCVLIGFFAGILY